MKNRLRTKGNFLFYVFFLNKINLIIDEQNEQQYYENFLNDKNLQKSERVMQMPSGKKVNVLVSRSVIEIGGRELALTSFVDMTQILLAEKKVSILKAVQKIANAANVLNDSL